MIRQFVSKRERMRGFGDSLVVRVPHLIGGHSDELVLSLLGLFALFPKLVVVLNEVNECFDAMPHIDALVFPDLIDISVVFKASKVIDMFSRRCDHSF